MDLRLGIRAHDFGRLPIEELARKIGSYGFNSIQLALAKAVSDLDSGLGKLSPGYGNYVAETLAKQGVRVAVLGCYINPINPNQEERRYEIDRFKEHLRYARDFGTSLVATETGRLDTYLKEYPNDYKEKAWTVLRETIEELAEQAEKYGVIAAIEPATSLTIHSTEGMLRMLEEVPSPNLGVLIDPCNLMDADNISRQDEVMEEAFRALAARTVLIHAKDIVKNEQGSFEYTGLGNGLLNYPLFLKLVRQHKPFIDITLEGITEDLLPSSLDYFTKVWNEVQL
jgi:sugar phosphate isomerase/epimerase